MSAGPPTQDIPDEVIESFASRLGHFAADLSPQERAVLRELLLRAAPPLQRMRWMSAEGLLEPAEQELLASLEKEAEAGGD